MTHPFAQQAFQHAGGEIIFHLPNDLQAYMLVGIDDNRIDEGPIPIVSDALKTSGTPAIVNGVSCMACHKHGMIPFEDKLRASTAVFGAAEEHVRKLYPPKEVMDRLVQGDAARFLNALEQAIGPFLRVGPDARKDLKSFPEPVGELARLYRLGYLNRTTIAAELDLENPDDLIQTLGVSGLKELGLEILNQPNGVIPRLEWEARDGVSLMQETARRFRFVPFNAL